MSEPSPPPGFSARRPTPADAPAVTEIVRAFELETEGEAEATEADIRSEWAAFDLSREAWLVEDEDGRAAAAVTVQLDGDVYKADGYVHPARRGHGLGGFLLDVTEAAARADGRADALRTGISMRDAAARALLPGHGYTAVRYYWTMTVELDPPLAEPAPPPGVTIEPVESAAWREFHAVKETAFADHWGYAPEPYEAWLARRQAHAEHDPSLWLVAREGGHLLGMIDCARQYGGGFVNAIGVLREARGRGIGEALLRRAFVELAGRGEGVVRLGVDATNPTGATRLYERVGMRVTAEYAIFEKPLAG